MNAFFFGQPQLYGVYHEPDTSKQKNSGIVLCCPIALEYIRSYWAIKQLAIRLAKNGYHVLRFDYSDTGNSAGANNETGVESWIEDILTATEELKALSGVRKISLIGLRFGALLAAGAAASRKLENLILWDPVFSGTNYLHSLRELDSLRYGDSKKLITQTDEILGFSFPSKLKESIEDSEILNIKFLNTRKIHCIISKKRADIIETVRLMTLENIPIDCITVDDMGDWDNFRRVEDPIIVSPILDKIVEKLK